VVAEEILIQNIRDKFFEVLQLQLQKTCTAIAFMYLWEKLDFRMFEQDSTPAHRACEKAEFLDRETIDFMSPCRLLLTR